MLFHVDRAGKPIKDQLREQIVDLVTQGILPPGARLPSSRSLARSLGIGRNTALEVYEVLIADGVLQTSGKSGTFVSWRAQRRDGAARGGQEAGSHGAGDDGWERLFSAGSRPQPAIRPPDARPRSRAGKGRRPDGEQPPEHWWDAGSVKAYGACLVRTLRAGGANVLDCTDSKGHPGLRSWLASYMAEKGASVDPEEVVLTAGYDEALALVCQVFLDPGELVWAQYPLSPSARDCFLRARAHIAGMPVAPRGTDLPELQERLETALPKLIYLMPVAHDPTGTTMDIPARNAVLRLIQGRQCVVVEGNRADPHWYTGFHVPALWAQGRSGRFVYLGSLPHCVFPGLRLGWIAAPRPVADALAAAKRTSVPEHIQGAMYEFLRRGHCQQHATRARRRYRENSQALTRALAHSLPAGAQVQTCPWTLSAWITLPEPMHSDTLCPANGGNEPDASGDASGELEIWPGRCFFPDGMGSRNLQVVWRRGTRESMEDRISRLWGRPGGGRERGVRRRRNTHGQQRPPVSRSRHGPDL